MAEPDRPAIVLASTGDVTTYRALEAASNQLARAFRAHGIERGQRVAFVLENRSEFFVVAWAAQRSGLYYTPISPRFTAAELAHVLGACRPQALVVSAAHLDRLASAIADAAPSAGLRLVVGDGDRNHGPELSRRSGLRFRSFAGELDQHDPTPVADEVEGADLLFSSGTTGRPKGIKRPLTLAPWGTPSTLTTTAQELYGFDSSAVFLSPGPLYHAAPLRFSLAAHRLGATVVLMDSFAPLAALASIERYRVTHGLWVPTMFLRLLSLPDADRYRFDLGSQRVALHGAGPCPIPVKEQMIGWWGPIIHEYYAGTEGNGYVGCTTDEWLERRGTVGRSHRGPLHVLDDAGNELPAGIAGTIYFETTQPFVYEDDPDATAATLDPGGRGWSTLGDVGYLDTDGYLYLTDRKAFLINSGGVNVAPQEIENVLTVHPKVADAAVFGVPDADLGEVVKAVVQPVGGVVAGAALEEELLEHCRQQLAPFKCPRSVDFRGELPRDPSGKLLKHRLRSEYQERPRPERRDASQPSASS